MTDRRKHARPRRPAVPAARIDVAFQTAAWRRRLPSAARICARAGRAAVASGWAKSGRRRSGASKSRPPVAIAILLSDDAAIAALNYDFRGKNAPTNVLAFPATPMPPAPTGVARDPRVPLGDIIVAFETTRREAASQGKTLAHHLTHLIVHAVLHLLGFDHRRLRAARVMETLEIEILAQMGIADPYRPIAAAKPPARPRAAARKRRR